MCACGVKDLGRCLMVCYGWYVMGSENRLWGPLKLRRASGTLATRSCESLSQRARVCGLWPARYAHCSQRTHTATLSARKRRRARTTTAEDQAIEDPSGNSEYLEFIAEANLFCLPKVRLLVRRPAFTSRARAHTDTHARNECLLTPRDTGRAIGCRAR
jgi:hypothetical protein